MRILARALTFVHLASAIDLQVSVPRSQILPNPAILPPTTHATLTTLSHIYTATLRTDNSFSFRNLSSGSYLLDVHCHTHVFAPLRVDVYDGIKVREIGEQPKAIQEISAWGTFRGNEWGNKGEVVVVADSWEGDSKIWTFEVKVLAGKEYLLVRQGFSPLSLLKNPMILIAGVSMIIVFGMPYLIDNMDPEMRAEFEQRQKSSPLSGGAAANPLQNFDAASWLAGSGTGGSSTSKKSDGVSGEKGVTR